MTVKLGFNVDHIATIREARKICEPDPIAAAVLAELAGAEGITMHLREDKQHIQDRDVQLLRRTVTTKMNLEICPAQEMVQVAINNQPDTVPQHPRSPFPSEYSLDPFTFTRPVDNCRPAASREKCTST